MDYKSLLNNLVTSGIEFSEPETLKKIRILNTFQLILFFVLSMILGPFYLYIGSVLIFKTLILASLLMIPGIIALRKTRNILLVGNYAVFILWAALFFIAWNTGAITYEGVIRPCWIMSAGLVLFAIFLNGYFSGTVWIAVVFVQTGIIVYLHRLGYQFPDFIPPEMTATYSMGAYLISLLIILAFAFLFEKEKNDALDREQEKTLALRESKRYIDYIFDRSPIPAFVLDKNHRVIQWNDACQKITGIPAVEIMGKKVWDGFDINGSGSIADMIVRDIDSVEETLSDSIVSRTDSDWFELNIFLPGLNGGQQVIITAAPILDNDGDIKGAIQTIQEIKYQDQELGLNVNFLEESFPKPVYRLDSQGKVNYWNDACEKMFGYTASKMIGKSPLGLLAKNYRSSYKNKVVKVLKGQMLTGEEWKYRNNKGWPVYVIAMALPSHSAESEKSECVVINTDVTDIRLKLKKYQLYSTESKETIKSLTEDYDLLKKNVATLVKKKPSE